MRKTSRNPKNHETLVKKGTNGKKSLVEDIWKYNFKAVFLQDVQTFTSSYLKMKMSITEDAPNVRYIQFKRKKKNI